MPSLLDPKFRYVPAAATDISKTFARIKREMAKAAEAAADTKKPTTPVVGTIRTLKRVTK